MMEMSRQKHKIVQIFGIYEETNYKMSFKKDLYAVLELDLIAEYIFRTMMLGK